MHQPLKSLHQARPVEQCSPIGRCTAAPPTSYSYPSAQSTSQKPPSGITQGSEPSSPQLSILPLTPQRVALATPGAYSWSTSPGHGSSRGLSVSSVILQEEGPHAKASPP